MLKPPVKCIKNCPALWILSKCTKDLSLQAHALKTEQSNQHKYAHLASHA